MPLLYADSGGPRIRYMLAPSGGLSSFIPCLFVIRIGSHFCIVGFNFWISGSLFEKFIWRHEAVESCHVGNTEQLLISTHQLPACNTFPSRLAVPASICFDAVNFCSLGILRNEP